MVVPLYFFQSKSPGLAEDGACWAGWAAGAAGLAASAGLAGAAVGWAAGWAGAGAAGGALQAARALTAAPPTISAATRRKLLRVRVACSTRLRFASSMNAILTFPQCAGRRVNHRPARPAYARRSSAPRRS